MTRDTSIPHTIAITIYNKSAEDTASEQSLDAPILDNDQLVSANKKGTLFSISHADAIMAPATMIHK